MQKWFHGCDKIMEIQCKTKYSCLVSNQVSDFLTEKINHFLRYQTY